MKNSMPQKGKITFSTILIMLVLFYGGFVAFKLISSSLTKAQIKSEIIDKFGYIRGPDFTSQKGEAAIRDILSEHNLYTEPAEEESEYGDKSGEEDGSTESTDSVTGTQIEVNIKQGGSKVHFKVEYSDVVNLILFKTKPRYKIDHEMFNYN